MNLSQLYYFKKLAELQHYTRAAKELFITQPTLSDSISSLEKELGVPLFYREGRTVELTIYGEEFYECVRTTLDELERGISAVRKHKSDLSGVINLGTAFTTLDDYLPPLINAFIKEYGPSVRINTFQGFTNYLTQGLLDKTFDVAFCGRCEGESDIEYHPVLYRDLILCVRKDHPFADRDRLCFDDLRDCKLFTYRRGVPIGEQVYRMLTEYGIENASQVYDDDITMASFVSFGGNVGALMLDSIGIKMFPSLRAIPIDEIPPRFYWVYLAYHKKYIRSSAVEALIAFVKNYDGYAIKDAETPHSDTANKKPTPST